MIKDDILKLAREAGFDPHDMSDDFTCNLKDIERLCKAAYAAGVAAASPPDIEALRQELDAALSDWNLLVKASGSPTHGGAVGYVANLRRENERLTKLFGTHPDGTNT
jgi:hypothetical protein